VENVAQVPRAANNRAKRRGSAKKQVDFSQFDRAFFMFVRTDDGVTLWNRSRSMLGNGHRPSEVALHLYENFGIRLNDFRADQPNPDRDRRALDFFARLPIPSDAIAPPSIFDECGGEA
jgi:hypothetical protein